MAAKILSAASFDQMTLTGDENELYMLKWHSELLNWRVCAVRFFSSVHDLDTYTTLYNSGEHDCYEYTECHNVILNIIFLFMILEHKPTQCLHLYLV